MAKCIQRLTGFTEEWHRGQMKELSQNGNTIKSYVDESFQRSLAVIETIGAAAINISNQAVISVAESGFEYQSFTFSFRDGFFSQWDTETVASGVVINEHLRVAGAAAATNRFLREEDRSFPSHFVQRKAVMFIEEVIRLQEEAKWQLTA